MKEYEKDNQSTDALASGQIWAIVITAIFVFALWLVNLLILINSKDTEILGNRGTFGDMFGAVNALFSGLAFGGIIWTILLQRNELKLQREESKQSRNEAIEQNKTLRLQRFENTLFNMLNLQNEIVAGLRLGNKHGREVVQLAKADLFAFLYIENYYKVHNTSGIISHSRTLENKAAHFSNARMLLDNYYHIRFYNFYSSHFNHYFRHLYHIFKFIHLSSLLKDEKKFYAGLMRAQLSQDELYLVAFNMIIPDYGKPNFLFLVREYDILQNFDWVDVTPIAFKELIDHELRNVGNPFLNLN